jgi:hypothetical protein
MGEQYVDLERARSKKTAFVDPFNRVMARGEPSVEYKEKLYDIAPSTQARCTRFPCTKCDKSFGKLQTVVEHLVKGNWPIWNCKLL